MKHKGTKVLKTQRFILRPFKIKDAEQMFSNYCNDQEVTKYLTWSPHITLQDTIDFLTDRVARYEKPNFYSWAIVDKKTKQVVGDITLSQNKRVQERASIGWLIAKKYWNQGCMTECAQEVLKYLKTVGFKRIEAIHFIPNVASGRVMQKLGFQFEGILKNYEYNNKGILQDVASYALIW